MSVLDELRSLEDRVTQRMRELRPAVAEYHELEQVAARLGRSGPPADGSRSATTAAPGDATRGRPTRRASRAASAKAPARARTAAARATSAARPGQRREEVLQLVQ